MLGHMSRIFRHKLAAYADYHRDARNCAMHVVGNPILFLAAVLPAGMRAAAIDISPETSAGGFILPDDRVDVVLTRRDKSAEKQTGVEKFVSDRPG